MRPASGRGRRSLRDSLFAEETRTSPSARPGGDQQDQWALHVFLRHVHHGLDLQAAIDAPEFHTDHFPSSFFPRQARLGSLAVESRLGEEAIDDLRSRGHDVTVAEPWSLGRVTAVAREDGQLKAGANPRGMQGYVAGR